MSEEEYSSLISMRKEYPQLKKELDRLMRKNLTHEIAINKKDEQLLLIEKELLQLKEENNRLQNDLENERVMHKKFEKEFSTKGYNPCLEKEIDGLRKDLENEKVMRDKVEKKLKEKIALIHSFAETCNYGTTKEKTKDPTVESMSKLHKSFKNFSVHLEVSCTEIWGLVQKTEDLKKEFNENKKLETEIEELKTNKMNYDFVIKQLEFKVNSLNLSLNNSNKELSRLQKLMNKEKYFPFTVLPPTPDSGNEDSVLWSPAASDLASDCSTFEELLAPASSYLEPFETTKPLKGSTMKEVMPTLNFQEEIIIKPSVTKNNLQQRQKLTKDPCNEKKVLKQNLNKIIDQEFKTELQFSEDNHKNISMKDVAKSIDNNLTIENNELNESKKSKKSESKNEKDLSVSKDDMSNELKNEKDLSVGKDDMSNESKNEKDLSVSKGDMSDFVSESSTNEIVNEKNKSSTISNCMPILNKNKNHLESLKDLLTYKSFGKSLFSPTPSAIGSNCCSPRSDDFDGLLNFIEDNELNLQNEAKNEDYLSANKDDMNVFLSESLTQEVIKENKSSTMSNSRLILNRDKNNPESLNDLQIFNTFEKSIMSQTPAYENALESNCCSPRLDDFDGVLKFMRVPELIEPLDQCYVLSHLKSSPLKTLKVNEIEENIENTKNLTTTLVSVNENTNCLSDQINATKICANKNSENARNGIKSDKFKGLNFETNENQVENYVQTSSSVDGCQDATKLPVASDTDKLCDSTPIDMSGKLDGYKNPNCLVNDESNKHTGLEDTQNHTVCQEQHRDSESGSECLQEPVINNKMSTASDITQVTVSNNSTEGPMVGVSSASLDLSCTKPQNNESQDENKMLLGCNNGVKQMHPSSLSSTNPSIGNTHDAKTVVPPKRSSSAESGLNHTEQSSLQCSPQCNQILVPSEDRSTHNCKSQDNPESPEQEQPPTTALNVSSNKRLIKHKLPITLIQKSPKSPTSQSKEGHPKNPQRSPAAIKHYALRDIQVPNYNSSLKHSPTSPKLSPKDKLNPAVRNEDNNLQTKQGKSSTANNDRTEVSTSDQQSSVIKKKSCSHERKQKSSSPKIIKTNNPHNSQRTPESLKHYNLRTIEVPVYNEQSLSKKGKKVRESYRLFASREERGLPPIVIPEENATLPFNEALSINIPSELNNSNVEDKTESDRLLMQFDTQERTVEDCSFKSVPHILASKEPQVSSSISQLKPFIDQNLEYITGHSQMDPLKTNLKESSLEPSTTLQSSTIQENTITEHNQEVSKDSGIISKPMQLSLDLASNLLNQEVEVEVRQTSESVSLNHSNLKSDLKSPFSSLQKAPVQHNPSETNNKYIICSQTSSSSCSSNPIDLTATETIDHDKQFITFQNYPYDQDFIFNYTNDFIFGKIYYTRQVHIWKKHSRSTSEICKLLKTVTKSEIKRNVKRCAGNIIKGKNASLKKYLKNNLEKKYESLALQTKENVYNKPSNCENKEQPESSYDCVSIQAPCLDKLKCDKSEKIVKPLNRITLSKVSEQSNKNEIKSEKVLRSNCYNKSEHNKLNNEAEAKSFTSFCLHESYPKKTIANIEVKNLRKNPELEIKILKNKPIGLTDKSMTVGLSILNPKQNKLTNVLEGVSAINHTSNKSKLGNVSYSKQRCMEKSKNNATVPCDENQLHSAKKGIPAISSLILPKYTSTLLNKINTRNRNVDKTWNGKTRESPSSHTSKEAKSHLLSEMQIAPTPLITSCDRLLTSSSINKDLQDGNSLARLIVSPVRTSSDETLASKVFNNITLVAKVSSSPDYEPSSKRARLKDNCSNHHSPEQVLPCNLVEKIQYETESTSPKSEITGSTFKLNYREIFSEPENVTGEQQASKQLKPCNKNPCGIPIDHSTYKLTQESKASCKISSEIPQQTLATPTVLDNDKTRDEMGSDDDDDNLVMDIEDDAMLSLSGHCDNSLKNNELIQDNWDFSSTKYNIPDPTNRSCASLNNSNRSKNCVLEKDLVTKMNTGNRPTHQLPYVHSLKPMPREMCKYEESLINTNVDFSQPNNRVPSSFRSSQKVSTSEGDSAMECCKMEPEPSSAYLPKFYTECEVSNKTNVENHTEQSTEVGTGNQLFISNCVSKHKTLQDLIPKGKKIPIERNILQSVITNHSRHLVDYTKRNVTENRKPNKPKIPDAVAKTVAEALKPFLSDDVNNLQQVVDTAEKLKPFDSSTILQGLKLILTEIVENGSGLWLLNLDCFTRAYRRVPPVHPRIRAFVTIFTTINDIKWKTPPEKSEFFNEALQFIEETFFYDANSNQYFSNLLPFLTFTYVSLARLSGKMCKVRQLLYDTLYCFSRSGLTISYIILTAWPAVLKVRPIQAYHGDPLALAVIHSLTSACTFSYAETNGSTTRHYMAKLRELMQQRYKFSPDTVDADKFMDSFIHRLSQQNTDMAMILIAKRKGSDWFLKKQFNMLISVISRWKENLVEDQEAASAVKILCCCTRALNPLKLQHTTMQVLFDTLRDLLTNEDTPHWMQETVALNLCRLSRINFSTCAEVILSWNPREISAEVADEILVNILARRSRTWWLNTRGGLNFLSR